MNTNDSDKMAGVAAKISALRQRHQDMERRVKEEQSRPVTSLVVMQRLKRERLRLKDEIVAHEGVLRTLGRGRRPAG